MQAEAAGASGELKLTFALPHQPIYEDSTVSIANKFSFVPSVLIDARIAMSAWTRLFGNEKKTLDASGVAARCKLLLSKKYLRRFSRLASLID